MEVVAPAISDLVAGGCVNSDCVSYYVSEIFVRGEDFGSESAEALSSRTDGSAPAEDATPPGPPGAATSTNAPISGAVRSIYEASVQSNRERPAWFTIRTQATNDVAISPL